MSEYSNLFDKKLIFYDVDAADRNDLYKKISDALLQKGFVKEDFYQALNSREDEFPTGIVTKYLPIALPHANPENVNKPFIAVVHTKKQIQIQQMGTNEDEKTKNFFFLGIVEETQDLQVKLLQRFMELMNDQNFVEQFVAIKNPETIYDFLINHF